jgi:hypothetical protein
MQFTQDSIQEQIPYYLTQEAKENLVKALSDFPNNTNYYINNYQKEILQGDGWDSLEIIRFENGERKLIKGILLSNSCDIDLDNKREFPQQISFSPIISLNKYRSQLISNGLDQTRIEAKVNAIKAQSVTNIFYLPKGCGLNEDFIALLNIVHTVPLHAFNVQDNKQKLFTMSQVGFYIFLFKLSVHFCRFHENIPRD